jgi:Fic family protein
MTYIHELPDWPNFTWDMDTMAGKLTEIHRKQNVLLRQMSILGFPLRMDAGIETLTLELVKSSAIEGVTVDAAEIRSSLARQLGLEIGGLKPVGRTAEGLAKMILDATGHYAEPLTRERLCGWHAALFPSENNMWKITVGAWRTPEAGSMQVISGPIGHFKVHYEAPAAERLEAEMEKFLTWFNQPSNVDPFLLAGIAHFWFVSIHPFEDGNGRLARVIADCALARADNCPDRFYSLSGFIEQDRKSYYEVLEKSQRGGLDITIWLEWFLGCLVRAIDGTHGTAFAVLRRAWFWQKADQYCLNDRQRLVLTRLLGDFKGKLTSGKYAKLAKCSSDSALRDIKMLMDYGLIVKDIGGGRSTGYVLGRESDWLS